MKLMWEGVDALDAPMRDATRAAVPERDLRMIEEAAPVAWLPIGVNLRATEAIWSTLGPGAREDFFRRLGGADFESSLLKATVTSAIRLFGLDPGKLLRWTPRGWSQVFRDQSRLTAIEGTDGAARLAFENLPTVLAESRPWLESVAASLVALYDVTRRSGTVVVEDAQPRTRTMVLLFRWDTG
jgi:hypothetical protein